MYNSVIDCITVTLCTLCTCSSKEHTRWVKKPVGVFSGHRNLPVVLFNSVHSLTCQTLSTGGSHTATTPTGGGLSHTTSLVWGGMYVSTTAIGGGGMYVSTTAIGGGGMYVSTSLVGGGLSHTTSLVGGGMYEEIKIEKRGLNALKWSVQMVVRVTISL